VKRGADTQAIDDLRWLGIDWDEGPIYQSRQRGVYEPALEKLLTHGDAYGCICTRKDVESARSAPHAEDGSTIYPGTCRNRFPNLMAAALAAQGRVPSVRFKHVPGVVRFLDQFAGPQEYDVGSRLGDFVIASADGVPSYQLAVVVDDAAMGVTDIVRGDDLLDSAARQILLYEHLNLEPLPRYWHLPLVVGPDGKRLAKRHGDTRLSHYRELGVSSERVLALLARWCGVDCDADMSLKMLLQGFRLDRVSHDRIVMTPADDDWLRSIPSPGTPGEG
jgi:glutamyl-tRNA synthetase